MNRTNKSYPALDSRAFNFRVKRGRALKLTEIIFFFETLSIPVSVALWKLLHYFGTDCKLLKVSYMFYETHLVRRYGDVLVFTLSQLCHDYSFTQGSGVLRAVLMSTISSFKPEILFT